MAETENEMTHRPMSAANPRLVIVAVRLTIPKEDGAMWVEAVDMGISIHTIEYIAHEKIAETRRMYQRLKGALAT